MNELAWQSENSVECKADKSFVWSYWTDVSNWERLEGDAVEWIKLHGPFAVGTIGETKSPGQPPHQWRIAFLDIGNAGIIEMTLDGALFQTEIKFVSVSRDITLITQRMTLSGPKAPELASGMQIFETNAPLGLAKLARSIEEAYLKI